MCADCYLVVCPDCDDLIPDRELEDWGGVCANCGYEGEQ